MTVLDDSAAVRTITTGVPAGDERAPDPVNAAIHLRPRRRDGVGERFAATDPASEFELTRFPRVATLVRSRRFQFFLILPNQIIFWLVIFVGILGTVDPVLNFGTAITWFVWFCLVFVLMVVVGRAWCAMCPFGGFAEWIQRRALWQRVQRQLGLGRKMPARVAQYGLLLSVASFLGLTFVEEYFNIAGPGSPVATSIMVLGIVATALAFFLVFERRTFCRYICPLSALIGSVGAMGSVAGFRTRDRDRCLECKTKDCMRGGTRGYGCPWYTWPGSADSNLTCGLCSECYKACPSGNVGLFLQKPLTSVIAPVRRRADVAWAVAILLGLVVFQQVNALGWYSTLDARLNSALHFPGYPNPVDYFGIIAVVAGALAALAALASRALLDGSAVGSSTGGDFMTRTTRFRRFFLPASYGLIPVVGADYFARQLPKFFQHSPAVVPAVLNIFGHGAVAGRLGHVALLPVGGIVTAQVVVIGLGTLGAMWSSWRIAGRDLAPVARRPLAVRVATTSFALSLGLGLAVLYVLMHGAN
ncbi:MAG TPA: 4Fe-4S binding protein [Acidimicrobiales bacterium]|nr:4Fe-4S binding protein [Acidimicrobiales bacterium]